jgi:hypothetical protein
MNWRVNNMSYKKFRVVSCREDAFFMVERKFMGVWWNCYVFGYYFSLEYESKEAAIEAIEKYNNRFTEVSSENEAPSCLMYKSDEPMKPGKHIIELESK